MSTSCTIVGATAVGLVRPRNEDTLVLLPDLGAVVVADGMGGAPGGDVASHTAAATVEAVLRERLSRAPGEHEGGEILVPVVDEAVASAHLAVRAAALEDAGLADMGTTLTLLLVRPQAGVWALGHVGDSRAYLLRDGRLVQLTRDQTWVQSRVDEGLLDAREALLHPYRHVLSQCIGSPEVPDPQITTGQARPGDLYLLCTDGLTGMVGDEDLAELLTSRTAVAKGAADTLGSLATVLVEAANARGGEDNVTVALVGIGEDGSATRAATAG